MRKKKTYEQKIQDELDKHQWNDAVCPSVAKFGKQADQELAKLKRQHERELTKIINELNSKSEQCLKDIIKQHKQELQFLRQKIDQLNRTLYNSKALNNEIRKSGIR